MNKMPAHFLYSDESLEDALFHYTTANGLMGIFNTGEIWSSAYYCANDESELSVGKGILGPLIKSKTYELIKDNDLHAQRFSQRGAGLFEYAEQFEQHIIALALNIFCAYITCFCKASNREDCINGLLSQWRGYGPDGGYALRFSRKKLHAAIENVFTPSGLDYSLKDVYYSVDNPIKDEVLKHKDAFVNEYMDHLDEMLEISRSSSKKTIQSPILSSWPGGPLKSFLNYLVYTKNEHFKEERECRLSLIQSISARPGFLAIQYFNRGGILVPYIKTPAKIFNILDCLEWIIIGPGPRMTTRFKAVSQLVKHSGREIYIQSSQIPYTKF